MPEFPYGLDEAGYDRYLEAGDELARERHCDHAGHEWQDAGGGLEICACCRAERWAE